MFRKLALLLLVITVSSTQDFTYSEELASKMINYAAATYYISSEEAAKNICPRCHPDLAITKIIEGNQLLAIVGYDPAIKSYVVSFRGSDNRKNWLVDDANIKKVDFTDGGCPKCEVHAGFKRAYNSFVKNGIRNLLKDLTAQDVNAKVTFTGHSLGGAIANLAAIDFKLAYPNRETVLYTYGQPRVGNKAYAQFHQAQISQNYRLVHNKDVVPHKPANKIGYTHSGYELWYSEGMVSYTACKGDSNSCSNSVGKFTLSYKFEDHGSANYLKLIPRVEAQVPQISPLSFELSE